MAHRARLLLNLRRSRLKRGNISCHQDHFRASLCQRLGENLSKPLPCAGNERNLSLQGNFRHIFHSTDLLLRT